jgi:hypothetical protein
MKRTVAGLVCCVCVLVSSACGGNSAENVTPPADVIFDSQMDEYLGGIRLAPRESQWDGFGEAVDMHGDVLVVGASEWNQLGPGSVYVYRSSSGEWREEAQLTAGNRDEFLEQAQQYGGQRFGTSVALGDGVIAVGAPGSVYSNPEYKGAVYIFEHMGDAWVETARLVPSGSVQAGEEDRLEWLDFNRMKPRVFGSHMALDGDTLAVGGDADGTIYIYQNGGNGWQEQTQITVPGIPERYFYMTSLSILGGTLAISAFHLPPQREQLLFLTGSVTVYVFERTGNSWEESFRFVPDDGIVEYLFPLEINVGAPVALGGDSEDTTLLAAGLSGFPDWSGDLDPALIGLRPEQISEFAEHAVSNRRSGAIYIFEKSEDRSWQQQATLKPLGWDDPPGPGSFSNVMPSHLEELSDAEKADFFSSHIFPGQLYSEIPEISFFGATVDMDGNRLAVTSGFANSTYIFERQDEEWIYRLRLRPENVKVELWEDFTQPVTISGNNLLLGTPSEFGNSAYVFDLCVPLALNC